jgi:uncharacterized membrane-anchored protein YjiN (DUF445 family)
MLPAAVRKINCWISNCSDFKCQVRDPKLARAQLLYFAFLTAENRHQPLLDSLIEEAAAALAEHESAIRRVIREKTAWVWQKLSVDEKISDSLITALRAMVQAAADDPQHEWRQRFDERLRGFVQELKVSDEYRALGESIKTRLLEHPALQQYLAGLWHQIKGDVAAEAIRPGSTLKSRLEGAIIGFVDAIERDPAMREKVNQWLRQAVINVANSNRQEIAKLIAETVRRWDTRTLIARIETEVGADLQFIRLNGTLIGGLAGLAIYVVSHLVF